MRNYWTCWIILTHLDRTSNLLICPDKNFGPKKGKIFELRALTREVAEQKMKLFLSKNHNSVRNVCSAKSTGVYASIYMRARVYVCVCNVWQYMRARVCVCVCVCV